MSSADLDLDLEQRLEVSDRTAVRLGIVLILIGLAGLVVFGGIAAGPVSAQEESENATVDEPQRVVAQVDSSVRVTDYGYNESAETFSIRVENTDDERPSAVTMTEVISDRGQSSGTFGVEQFQLAPGEEIEVEIRAALTSGSAAVMIVTQESLDDGEGSFVRYEADRIDVLTGEPTVDHIQTAGVGGAAGVVLLLLLLAWHKIGDDDDSIEEVV
jgi:archaellum component FlaF (FlaF/FlaG flagellin family)